MNNNSNSGAHPNQYDDLSNFIAQIQPSVIPIPFMTKKAQNRWKHQQNSVTSGHYFERCTKANIKCNWGIITGKILQGQYKDKYLTCIDLDNKKAIEVFLSYYSDINSIEELSKTTIVVQHDDAKNEKAHVYLITEKQITKRNRKYSTCEINDIPKFEVKSDSSTYVISPDSTHPNGYQYKIICTHQPMVLNEEQSDHLEKILAEMYEKYIGISQRGKSKLPLHLRRIARSLIMDNDASIIEEGTRNQTLFDITMCMIGHHYGSKEEKELRDFLYLVNEKLCKIPLPDDEIDSILNSAFGYAKNNDDFAITKNNAYKNSVEESNDIVEQISEEIQRNAYFLTLEESKEILYYQNGVYNQGGEILIETEAENLYGYNVKNKHIAEIKSHIMRRTYHKRSELDSDPNIINLQNGLYNVDKNELSPHDPQYLSINQIPIKYDQKARPKLFGKFLRDVLYHSEIRTAVETMAYTFYRDCPFEYFFILFGDGSNGKSVFTGLVTTLHGTNNVSNVSMSSLTNNRFALSDLEFKDVNIDSELTNQVITDTSILKKLTGGRKQPIRIERKNKDAYDVYLYAKLFFNTNSINGSIDQTTAYYRRIIIISFPNKFEGKNEDPYLLNRLTSEDELSGIFNILMHALRNVLKKKGIHLNEKTIEERRLRHEKATDPIKSFIGEAVAEDSTENDWVIKDDFYNAYVRYCKKHKLAIKSKEIFGKELKKKMNYSDSRKGNKSERKTCWLGIRLNPQYLLDEEQKTIDVLLK